MKINYNVSAAIALNSLNRNDNRLQNALTRLSSGFKINNAKDNPSGLAMAKRMNAQIEGVSQATLNAGDGVSIIEIADGAMSEIHDMLQRINELAVKASTGTITDGDREMIDNEIQQLKEEITRISNDTEFNGQKLLDGSFDLRGYTLSQTMTVTAGNANAANVPDAKVLYYSDTVLSGEYTLDMDISFNADGTIDSGVYNVLSPTDPSTKVPSDITVTRVDGNIATLKGSGDYELRVRISAPEIGEQNVTVQDDKGNNVNLTVAYNTDGTIKEVTGNTLPADAVIEIKDGNTVKITGTGVNIEQKVEYVPVSANVKITMNLEGFGAMDQQIGANEGQQIAIRIPKVSLENMGIANIDMRTQESSEDALSRMDGAIKYVSSVRSRLGAYQNRLEHTISSLDITNENVTAAYSRIMDTDMAEEMTEYTTMQVLAQASTSMLAQANERPSQVLQLLQ